MSVTHIDVPILYERITKNYQHLLNGSNQWDTARLLNIYVRGTKVYLKTFLIRFYVNTNQEPIDIFMFIDKVLFDCGSDLIDRFIKDVEEILEYREHIGNLPPNYISTKSINKLKLMR